MDEQRRIFIAIALCLAIAFVWQWAMQLRAPAPAPRRPPAAATEPPPPAAAPGKLEATAPGAAPAPAPAEAPAGAPERLEPIDTQLIGATLSSRGGLTSVFLKDYKETPQPGAPPQPVSLVTATMGGEKQQALVSFDVGGQAGPSLAFGSSQGPGYLLVGERQDGLRTEVRVVPRADRYAFDYELSVINKSGAPQKAGAAVRLGLTPSETAHEGGFMSPPADMLHGFCAAEGSVTRWVDKEAKTVQTMANAAFVGLDRQYFVVAALAEHGAGTCSVSSQGRTVFVDYGFSAGELAAGGRWTKKLTLYLGPKRDSDLKAVAPVLGEVIDYTIWHIPLGFLARPMVVVMNLFHSWTGSWGIAIILLTFLVKLLLFPVTYKSSLSMRRMQLIKPELDKLKERFGKDPERMQAEQMKLFREKGVNPLGGCLPMLLQMPVWFALYRTLWTAVDLYQQNFLWLHDLTAKEPFPFLAIALGGLTIVQQRLTPTTTDSAQAKFMMYAMPLMFTVFMISLPSGLVLYIVVNSILTIVQQLVINRRQIAL
jgi:YidC/Oxa1 family membrane protein insertase